MGSLNCSLVLMHAIDKNASRESIIIAFNTMMYNLWKCCFRISFITAALNETEIEKVDGL